MFSTKQHIEISSGLNKFLSSGISMQSSLFLLQEEINDKKIKKLLGDMIIGIENGINLSKTIEDRKELSLIFKNFVYIGESTGNITKTLEHITKYYEESMDTKRELIGKMIYPSIILVAILIMSFGYTFILAPIYKNITTSLGTQMPTSTLAILKTCEFFKNNIINIILFSIAIFIMSVKCLKIKKIRYTRDKIRFHNKFFKLVNLREVFFSMHLLLSSGVGIISTIDILEQNANNVFLKEIMAKIKNDIKCGKNLNEIVKNYVKDKRIVYMISVGERTGNIEENIWNLSNLYDKELKFNIKILNNLMEPGLIIFLSVVSAFLMVFMLMPIYTSLVKLN
jgi:type II secretory pathway component PulF